MSVSENNEFRKVKTVFLGDLGVGKTSMLLSYTLSAFPRTFIPPTMDDYPLHVVVDKLPTLHSLHDTYGQTNLEIEKLLLYPNTDVFVLCYDIIRPNTFDNLREIWYPAARSAEPNAQFVIVGIKSDLLSNAPTMAALAQSNITPISEQQALAFAEEIGAYKAIQTRPLDHDQNGCFASVFTTFVRAKFPPKHGDDEKSKKCCIQ